MKQNAPLVVGLVGLGLVGTALAQRLSAAGFGVLGYDHRPEACAAFAATGHEVAHSLRQIGERVSVVVLAVFDTAGVIDVVEGPQGLMTSTVSAIIDCSTGEPSLLAELAARLSLKGVDFIEAPLSGSSSQIAAGKATVLLGATTMALARHAPVLEALAAHRIHVGGAGMGAKAKLATNLVLGLNRAVLAEGMVFAESLGIAPAQFLALVLATPARSDAALAKGQMMVNEDFAPQSRIRQHLKDVNLMLADAAALGQNLPFSQTHAALMTAAIAAGDGDLDNAAIIRQLRREVVAPTLAASRAALLPGAAPTE